MNGPKSLLETNNSIVIQNNNNSNSKKRKLNECIENSNNASPKPKKRQKINGSNIMQKIKDIHKENNELKLEINKYKNMNNYNYKQMIYYKEKYLKIMDALEKCGLSSQSNTNNNNNNEMEIEIEIINVTEENIQNAELNTNPKDENEEYEMDINNILNTNNNIIIPSSEDALWSNTHIFKVKCHICNIEFNECNIYIKHLKSHYLSSDWLRCDYKNCNKFEPTDRNFITHLARHQNIKLLFCNVKTNNIKCNYSTNYNYSMKEHINKKHYNNKSVKLENGYHIWKRLHSIFKSQIHSLVVCNNIIEFNKITKEVGFNNNQKEYLYQKIQMQIHGEQKNPNQNNNSKNCIYYKPYTIVSYPEEEHAGRRGKLWCCKCIYDVINIDSIILCDFCHEILSHKKCWNVTEEMTENPTFRFKCYPCESSTHLSERKYNQLTNEEIHELKNNDVITLYQTD